MRIHQPICPQCGEPAAGTVERINGRADFIDIQPDGTTDYSGNTEIWWDEQRTVSQNENAPEGPDNLPLVVCCNGHDWPTPIDW